MAALLTSHAPIICVGTISGNQEKIQNFLESAGLNVQPGTPVSLNGSGNTIAWSGTPTFGPPGNVLGVIATRGKNLASAGQGASPIFGSIGYPGGMGALQDVPNQPVAYSIYHGAPFVDGLSIVTIATLDTIFEVQVDASSGTTYNATTALIGTSVGLTVDANGFWYADLSKSTVGTNAVGVVVSLNQLDMVPGSTTAQQPNGKIRIVFDPKTYQVTN